MIIHGKIQALGMFAAVAAVSMLLGAEDSTTAAQRACEHHIEAANAIDLSVDEVASMHVSGNVVDGKVQGAFFRDGVLRYAVCVFENGQPKRATIDGSSWPDDDHAAIRRLQAATPHAAAPGGQPSQTTISFPHG